MAFSPAINSLSFEQSDQTSPLPARSQRNSRNASTRGTASFSCLSFRRITFDRPVRQLESLVVVVEDETKFSQGHGLLKETFCLAGNDLTLVHQHLLFLKTLRNSLGDFEKFLQAIAHARMLNIVCQLKNDPVNCKSLTSDVVVVRPVKSLIQSLKQTSAIRLYSRMNSRN